MRRRALGALAVVVAVALTLPAVGAATITGSTRLFVTPTRPGPLTNVVVRFRQPTLGGLLPADQTNESLVVTGPTRMGCVGGLDRSVTTVEAGTAMRETLRPARFVSGRWCVGRYRVALQVSQVSACPAGTAHRVCPEYVSLPRTVATAHFRITRG